MATEYDKSRPPWSSRLLAAVGYLGLTPVLRLCRVRRHDIYLRHHQAQGLAALVLLLPLLLIWPISDTLETYLFRRHVGQASDYHAADAGIMVVVLGGLALWGLISMVAIGMAIAGSTRPLPLIAWLARRSRLMRVALIGNSVLLALVVLVVGLAIHASSLAREDAVPAPVYFLYDNRDYEFLGAWGPKLFCYRISRVAQERWGPGSVVVAPITAENFRTAITHGRFVVLQSHGKSGAMVTTDGYTVWPNSPAMFAEDRQVFPVIGFVRPNFATTSATPGKDLQFVYISACNGGELATEWDQRFAPAEVVTFDRLTGAMETLWWLWFDGPDRLKEIR